eukprot:gene43584-47571_t
MQRRGLREARSAVLDTDAAFGRVREPIVKLAHFMRAMEYTTKNNSEVFLANDKRVMAKFGEMAYKSPSVFNFYQSDYEPMGPVSSAGLVAPESQLLTGPLITGSTNALVSLVNYGLIDCDNGLAEGGVGGYHWPESKLGKSVKCDWIISGAHDPREYSLGDLEWEPSGTTASGVVGELDVLLTQG